MYIVFVRHTVDACSEFRGAFALNSEKDESEISHFLEIVTALETPSIRMKLTVLQHAYPVKHNNILDIIA